MLRNGLKRYQCHPLVFQRSFKGRILLNLHTHQQFHFRTICSTVESAFDLQQIDTIHRDMTYNHKYASAVHLYPIFVRDAHPSIRYDTRMACRSTHFPHWTLLEWCCWPFWHLEACLVLDPTKSLPSPLSPVAAFSARLWWWRIHV